MRLNRRLHSSPPTAPRTRRAPRATLLMLTLSLAGCAGAQPTHEAVAVAGAPTQPPGIIAFVLSAVSQQELANGEVRETGFFLNEFYEAYAPLTQAGYQIVIATVDGRAPVIDPESLKPKYWSEGAEQLAQARRLVAQDARFRAPLTLAQLGAQADTLQGLIVPGGQGVMFDLVADAQLHALIIALGSSDRPVGLICHAPVILARLPLKESPFQGRLVTSVSGLEEWFIETFIMGAEAKDRALGDQLEGAGYHYVSGRPGSDHATRDCNLVTSQNPYSGDAFNERFLAALSDWRRGGRCQRR